MGISHEKIKGVLLDLDDTLYSYSECNNAGKKAVFKFLRTKLKIPNQKIKKLFEQAREETHVALREQVASHSRLLYIQKCLETILGKTNLKLTLEAEKIFWSAFLKEMRLKSGILEILKSLKSKHPKLKICIVTDLTSEIQFRKIIKLKIDKYIDFVVTSEEAGAEKPNSKIFMLALKKLGLKPSEVVMIGDSPEKDITGAEKLGIMAIPSVGLLGSYF